jgi:CDP-4-dehydro-6-deoxyglucose reductase, E3
MAASEFLCTVKSFRMLTPTVFEVTFETQQPLSFAAGQFISVVVPGAGPKGRDLRRAYSIASAPDVYPIELCVKLVEGGPGTNYLYQLRPGDTFRGYAPYGDFVYHAREGRHACFISTGTGIAPFRAMVQSKEFQASPPASTTCLLGVRDEAELLYMEDFEKLSFVKWVPAVSRPTTGEWKGFRGRVTDYLRSLGDSYPWQQTEFYLCGGSPMIDETKLILAEKGVAKESIHQEVYYKPPKEKAPATTPATAPAASSG